MKIITRRLEIRPFEFADWKALQRIVLDFQSSEYRYFDRCLPSDDAGVQSAARYAASSGMWFAVCLGGEAIGYVCFHEENGFMDVGYCFLSAFHGCGYASESISALLELLSSIGITRFSAGTALDNAPSVKLLNRLGFRLTGTEEVCFYEGHPFTGGIFHMEK